MRRRAVHKHSIAIRGHRTSFSIEDEFYVELRAIAAFDKLPLARLITEIDAQRQPGENLSSALRLHVLRSLKGRIKTA